jgi:hypothetical protein
MRSFCNSLLLLDVERWERVLGALELPSVYEASLVGLDDADLSTLSAFWDDLGDFPSPVKDSGNRMRY